MGFVLSYASHLTRFISESGCGALPSPDRDSRFNQLAQSLFAFQFEQVPVYRNLCLAGGVTPDRILDWTQIPVVPMAAFKEFELTSLPPAQRTRVFHSSGTTHDTPSRNFHDDASLRLYEASLLPWFRRHLLAGSDSPPGLLALTPGPAAAPHSSLVHMFETVRRHAVGSLFHFSGMVDSASAWHLNPDPIWQTLQHSVESGKPLAVLGTAFSFVHLIELLETRGTALKLPPGSRVMETGGYKGRSRSLPREQLHERIGERLGVPASWMVCEYGMSELSSQAYDHIAGSGDRSVQRTFRFPPWARARIVSPETGREVALDETGLIQVFDLANVRSLMAIQTDDLGVRRHDGFDLLGRAVRAEARGCSLQLA